MKYSEFATAAVSKKQPFVPGEYGAEYDPGTRLDAFGRAPPENLAQTSLRRDLLELEGKEYNPGTRLGVPELRPATNEDKPALPALTAPLPVRALAAATQRYAPRVPASPAELGPALGYGAAYNAARDSGRFTPQQLEAAEAARAKYATTPLGLQGEGMRIGSEGTLADITANIAEQRALANAQERADAASANAAVVDEAQAKRFEAMRAEFDESQNKRLADMDELRADISKTKIDPSQYWSKGSGFGQALSLLSVAIGGFAKGYSGGRLENTGLKMLDQAIDRDIAAQRDNLSTKRGLLAESQSVFAMARQKFGDDQAAAEFTKARQNETLKNAAARYQGEARTEAMRANAAKLEQHFGLEMRRSDNNVQQLYAQAEAARLKAAAGAAAGAASAEEREDNKKLARRSKVAAVLKAEAEATKSQIEARGDSTENVTGKDATEMLGRYVPALGAVAGTAKQASDMNEGLALIEKTTKLVEKMSTLRDTGTTGAWGSTDKSSYDALRTEAIAAANRSALLGSLDKGTVELFNENIPESALLSFDSNAIARLEVAKGALATGRAAAIANAPLVKVGLEQTKRGPVFTYGEAAPATVTPTQGWSKK